MDSANPLNRPRKTREKKLRSGANSQTAQPAFDLTRHQFFLASANVADWDEDIHFLVSEEEGRSGLKISEIVLKCLLPSRHPSRWADAQGSRATLRAIRPVDFVEARGAQIPCLGVTGIRFWRLQE